jgi:hypothetical protein
MPADSGIDEHFFTRRHGYATTSCDLKNHKVHDKFEAADRVYAHFESGNA